MWGKPQFIRSRKATVQEPTLVEDNGVFRSRPLGSKGLPTLPSNPSESSLQSYPLAPEKRVTSSVYSKDDFDEFTGNHAPQRTDSLQAYSPEISPPDSPVTLDNALERLDSSRISPVEEEWKQPAKALQPDKRFPSQLPVLRKPARADTLPLQSDLDSSKSSSGEPKKTKWDDYSGEPTTSNSGKPGQVTPGSPVYESHQSQRSLGFLNWGREQLQPKKKSARPKLRSTSLMDKNEPRQPPVREPWKGASGRAPIVTPIQEKPGSKFVGRLRSTRSQDLLQTREEAAEFQSSIGFTPTVVTTITAGEAIAPARSETKFQPINREESPPARRTPDIPPRIDISTPDLDDALSGMHVDERPVSRFSATTYAPTEAESATGSPRDSLIESDTPTGGNVPSIMSRKRPVPSAYGAKPTRKPTPAEGGVLKALPQSPPESQAQTRIEALEARRDNLNRRKANINTIIYELTQVIQPSSVAYDMAAREEVKKTVNSLNNELAEIKREEHEIGLKLLRAYKKRDEQDIYSSGSGLWVKRVTS